MAWVDITASAHCFDYNGYIRYANQVLNIAGAMTTSSPNGLCVYNIQPNTHYRVTMVMQNRFRLACVENLITGQTVTNYVFDPLDVNDATNQNASRTLEITSEAGQVYLCVGMWSTGAADTLYNTLATIVVEEEQVNVTTYTVTFEDHDGTVLKTQTVYAGEDATPPADPTRSGYVFTGWSGSYVNVQSDITITAQYEYVAAAYTVTFNSRNGVALKTETVIAGWDATPPTAPTISGYVFTGWSGAYTNVQADITVTAQYRLVQTYTVRFLAYNSLPIKTQQVIEGESAVAPLAPIRTGYTFIGWSEDVSVITADTTARAMYARDAEPPSIKLYSGETLLQTITKATAVTLRDALDGELTLTFSTLAARVSSVQTGQIARLGAMYFNIVRVQKQISQGLWMTTVTGEHITYILNNDSYKITAFDFTGSPATGLAQLLSGTPFSAGIVEYADSVTMQINQECTRRSALMQFIAILGGEIEYDGYNINIRQHRGSTTAKELMECRNVTSVGVTYDSRADSASYEIAFYRLVDIAVGDQVHIVFHPLGINVNTRIISLEYNPFYRYDARVEIGSYIPSINDSLYRLEEKIDSAEIDIDTTELDADISALQLDVGTLQTDVEELETDVEDLRSARIVTNLFVNSTSFSVTYSDDTIDVYNYTVDADGHITGITKISS